MGSNLLIKCTEKRINMNYLEQQTEQLLEQRTEKFIKDSLFSDEVLDMISENMRPIDTLMSYYKCASMEVETKFKVLNEQFSLKYDCNPIESIKTRIKSMDSILKKIRRKNIPLSFEAIENEIRDIAGVRVICSFIEDIYMLADCFLAQDDITLIEIKDYIKKIKVGFIIITQVVKELVLELHL